MHALKPLEKLYWESYVQTLPMDQRPTNALVIASFAGTLAITDDLLALYLSGKKTAGSSVLEDFLMTSDPPPKAGNYWIYLNSHLQPSCILRTERVVTHKFKDVPVEIAIAEGEGDLSLEHWRKVHAELYLPHLKSWGLTEIGEATVLTEFFSIVYKSTKA